MLIVMNLYLPLSFIIVNKEALFVWKKKSFFSESFISCEVKEI